MSTLPDVINISMDVPIDLKARTTFNGIDMMYCFNFNYKTVGAYNIFISPDGGDNTYGYVNAYAIVEIKGGLAYFDYGWKVFDNIIQEKYADYIMEQEVLVGTKDE